MGSGIYSARDAYI